MSLLAPTMQAFFTDYLARQRSASPNTVASYKDTFRLLLAHAKQVTGKQPSALDFADLHATLVAGFLDHLETSRANSIRTRNARLAAIHSLFRYAALRHPEHAATIARVLAIPNKRHERALVTYLNDTETQTLLAAPDTTTWLGRRDRTLLALATQCGLRVSEIISLTLADLHLGTGPYVRCHGKGRKERVTPLTPVNASVLKAWVAERAGRPADPLFPTRQGKALGREAVANLVARHAHTAAASCPSIATKTVTPHTLRHTAAMALLHAGVDTTVIALWLGHEQVDTTSIYLHADLTIKQKALELTTPPTVTPGRYKPTDTLLAFLEAL